MITWLWSRHCAVTLTAGKLLRTKSDRKLVLKNRKGSKHSGDEVKVCSRKLLCVLNLPQIPRAFYLWKILSERNSHVLPLNKQGMDSCRRFHDGFPVLVCMYVSISEAASTQWYIFLKHLTATLRKNIIHPWGSTRVSAMIFLPLKDPCNNVTALNYFLVFLMLGNVWCLTDH